MKTRSLKTNSFTGYLKGDSREKKISSKIITFVLLLQILLLHDKLLHYDMVQNIN